MTPAPRRTPPREPHPAPARTRFSSMLVVGGAIGRALLGAGMLATGILLLASPLTALATLPWLLGLAVARPAVIAAAPIALTLALIALTARGASRALAAPRSRTDRLRSALSATTAAIGAALAALWPDAALLLIAWGMSALLIAAGVLLLRHGLAALSSRAALRARAAHRIRRASSTLGSGRQRSGKRRSTLRLIATATATALAVGLGAGSAWAAAQTATPDDFYEWSGALPESAGTLLRIDAYTGEHPAGSRALRILYTTTRADDSIALASAVVAIPTAPAEASRPVLAWQHGTTGVAAACAPSLTATALTPAAIPGITEMLERGWIVVATDYPGQGTTGRYPYLIGVGEGRATLDAVRAVRALDAASLTGRDAGGTAVNASNRVMLWGHSQGGHATLWAGQIAESYAPELDIVGVAALSAAADPLAMAERVTQAGPSAIADAITSYVAVPYADEYDDVELTDLVHPAGTVFARAAASRCALDPGMLVTILVGNALGDRTPLYRLDLDSGPVHDRLTENIADGRVNAPLFLGQGIDDEVVPIAIQRRLAADLVAAGRDVEVHEYPGRTHMGVIAEDSPLITDLLAWADAISDPGIAVSATR